MFVNRLNSTLKSCQTYRPSLQPPPSSVSTINPPRLLLFAARALSDCTASLVPWTFDVTAPQYILSGGGAETEGPDRWGGWTHPLQGWNKIKNISPIECDRFRSGRIWGAFDRKTFNFRRIDCAGSWGDELKKRKKVSEAGKWLLIEGITLNTYLKRLD